MTGDVELGVLLVAGTVWIIVNVREESAAKVWRDRWNSLLSF